MRENDKLTKIEEINGLIPLLGFKNYRVDIENGRIYSLKTDKFLLSDNPVGVGDKDHNGKGYLMTKLISDEGKVLPVYVHQAVMCAAMGIRIEQLRDGSVFPDKMEVNHVDRSLGKQANHIWNLELCTRKNQYDESVLKDMSRRGKMSKESAVKIRDDFKQWRGKKIQFYKQQAEQYGMCARSIQNICLGISHKSVS